VRGPFRRRGRTVVVALPADERAVLARLLGDVHQMLDDGADDVTTDRDPLADLVGVDDDWLSDVAAGTDGDTEPDVATAGERFEDPAVARLLPDGSRDDPAATAEFRRLTEHGLRHRKRAALDRARNALHRPDPVVLDADEAQALLKGLTDVRLVIAERLGLHTDQDAETVHAVLARAGDSDEPWVVMAALYDALTWWQEALVRELPR
jgi:hypothetical protein